MNKIADARSDDVGPLSNLRSPYFSPEHEMLRAQVRRFVETEIKPQGAGLGGAGLRTARGAAPHGRARLSRHPLSGATMAARRWTRSARRARRGARPLDVSGVSLSRCSVHTDMASVPCLKSGIAAQKDSWMPRIISGRDDHRGRGDRAGCRLRREGHPHHRAARRRQLRAQRHQDVHHQRRLRRSLLSSPPRPPARGPRSSS